MGFAIVFAAVLIVAIPLAIHTRNVIEEDQFERLVARSVATWDPRAQLASLDTSPGAVWQVDLRVIIPGDPSPGWRLADIITEESDRPIDLSVTFTSDEEQRVSTR
jgi:hypothetical protein